MSPYTHHLTNAQLERLALALSDLTDALDAQETEDTELLEACREEIQRWARAYSPDILVAPAEAEIRAVNRTLEFGIGRNAALLNIREKLLLPLLARLNERLGTAAPAPAQEHGSVPAGGDTSPGS